MEVIGRFAGVLGVAFGLVLAGTQSGMAQAQASARRERTGREIQADVAKALDNKKIQRCEGFVQNGVVTLTGTVDLYAISRMRTVRCIIARM